jgi:hypothetical protein
MGTERGLDWRIQIGDGGGPEVFTNIGGEISFDWKRSSEEIDESTKDDGIYGSTSYGQQKIMISVNGNLKLPDTASRRRSRGEGLAARGQRQDRQGRDRQVRRQDRDRQLLDDAQQDGPGDLVVRHGERRRADDRQPRRVRRAEEGQPRAGRA